MVVSGSITVQSTSTLTVYQPLPFAVAGPSV
jgi:hypothetical protein